MAKPTLAQEKNHPILGNWKAYKNLASPVHLQLQSSPSVGLTTTGQKLLDQSISDLTGLGVNAYGNGYQVEIGRCDIGPNKDSNILLQTHDKGGDHVHHCKLHGSGSSGGMGYGTHGIYDASAGSFVEYCDSWAHANGSCFSPRWPNAYFKNITRDSPAGYGVFDYSDGKGGTLLLREEITYNLTGFWVYFGPGRQDWHTDITLSKQGSFGLCADHCTLDLRKCPNGPVALQDLNVESYVTNSIIIWDGTKGQEVWEPRDGTLVHLDGTVVLTSAQAAQWLNADYSPKQIAGSPLIGKAVASPPRASSLFKDLPDVGCYQAASPPKPVDPAGALADNRSALAHLQKSSGYKNAKRDNPNPSSFAKTEVGQTESAILSAINKLGG